MNLTVYNPDEPEEPEDSPIHEAREGVEKIVPFSVAPPMTVEEVAAILGKTEEKILFGISCGKLPARDIGGEWRIDREAFERDRSSIDCFFEDDPNEEEWLKIFPSDE